MIQLATLPEARDAVIVIGTSVRKPLPVLKPYLDSLAWQEFPPHTKPHYVFVPDFTTKDSDAEQYLRQWVKERGGEVLRAGPLAPADFDDTHPITHQWSTSAMARVGENKNRILRRALELNADAVFLADADLILDRTTVHSLWMSEKPVACAVYWTHWQRQTRETQPSHSMPQVWLRHPYQLDGRGYEHGEFRAKLVNRSLTRVWGQGACTLIRTPVIRAGVNFSHLQEPALLQGMMAGEDRHFCIKAERLHCEMWADAWPDIFHIYHAATDLPKVAAMTERLGLSHPDRAALGDWVSLRLLAEEPFPQPNGQWHRTAPQYVRGRLGALPLLPELEEAVLQIPRGTSRVVPVHVPIHWPMQYMRGRRRLIHVTLVDCKPYQYPPVLGDELFPMGGHVVDTGTITPQQVQGIQELQRPVLVP